MLTPEEQELVNYLRVLIKKATPETDVVMLVDQPTWATYLEWALDKLEEAE